MSESEEELESESEEGEEEGEVKKDEVFPKTYLNLLDCAASLAGVLVLYFFDGELDEKKLNDSLQKTVSHLPQLSSVLKSEDGKFHSVNNKRYYLSHVTPSNVTITKKDVDPSTFELFKLDVDKSIDYSEGGKLYLLCDHAPVGVISSIKDNLPIMKVTLLYTKEKEKKSILALSINHCVVDAHAFGHIMTMWSDFYNGRKNDEVEKLYVDRVSKFMPSNGYENMKTNVNTMIKLGFERVVNPVDTGEAFSKKYHCRNIVFTKERIEELKKKVKTNEKFSSHDVISGHLYKLFAVLREFPNDTIFPHLVSMNFRGRISSIPSTFFGNAVCSLMSEKTRKEVLDSSYTDVVMNVRKLVNSFNDKDFQSLLDQYERKLPLPPYNWLHGTSINDWRGFSKHLPIFGGLKPIRLSYAPPPGIMAPNFYILQATGKDYKDTCVMIYIEEKVYKKIDGDKIDFTAYEAFEIVKKKMKENTIPERFSKEFLTHLAKKLSVPKISSMELLGSGMNFVNSNYLVEYSEGKGDNKRVIKQVVLRVYEEFGLRSFKEEPAKHEFEAIELIRKNVKDIKFTPKPLFYDDSKKILDREYLVEEYVCGARQGGMKELTDEKSLKKFAVMLRKIHSIRKKIFTSKGDTLSSDYEFHRDITKNAFLKDSVKLDMVMESKIKNFSKRAKAALEKSILVTRHVQKKFQNLPRDYLIHGDAHVGNLLINDSRDSITLVDFEFTRWCTFYEDLAQCIACGMLKAEFEKVFLNAYFGSEERKNEKLDRELLWAYKIKMTGLCVGGFIHLIKTFMEKKEKIPEIHLMILQAYFGHFENLLEQ